MSSFSAAKGSGKGLRLRVHADEGVLSRLPWELLWRSDINQPLASSEWHPVVRFIPMPFATRPLAIDGRLRVLLVSAVPTDFVYAIEGSSNSARQNNGIWNYTVNFFGFSVPDREGVNGLPWQTANDPRVPFEDAGTVGFDGETPFFIQGKNPTKESNTILASGVEARLIEAEAALQGGNSGLALQFLNTLRQSAGLSPLAAPGTPAARIDQLFRERAFWLYLTGHRLGDLRRLVRQYGRSQASVFPVGDYHKGGEYGSDVNFPVSSDERNNPNFEACLDRNA